MTYWIELTRVMPYYPYRGAGQPHPPRPTEFDTPSRVLVCTSSITAVGHATEEVCYMNLIGSEDPIYVQHTFAALVKMLAPFAGSID